MEPGVHLVAREDRRFVPELRTAGDVLHVGAPHIDSPLSDDVQRTAHAVELMEASATRALRDSGPMT